jgi:hypothetical protein
MVNVVGHKDTLETTLRDRIDDIDDADRSGPSRRTDFSQSTGNSTNNTDATTRMHTHRKRALTTIALVNKNSTLTNNLEDAEERLNTMIAQNLALQGQLAGVSNNAHDTSNNISQEQDSNIRMDEEGPDMIQGGGVQGWSPRVQSTRVGQGSATSPATFVQALQYYTESGHRPASRSSITKLHYSATNTQQDVESASKGGSEELSL